MLVRTGMFSAGINVPTIASFTLTTPTKASGCYPVAMSASWTISYPDNVGYKLVIQETGVEFNCLTAIGTTVYIADSYQDGSLTLLTPTLTLRVVRRSDSVVMSSVPATCTSGISVGVPCI